MCKIPVGKDWIEVLQGLLTPVIAVITVYIAYMQHKLDKRKHIHDLFELRREIYNKIVGFIAEVLRKSVKGERIDEFYRETKYANFIFDKNINDYVDDVYSKANELEKIDNHLKRDIEEKQREMLEEKRQNIRDWFQKQLREKYSIFDRYLKL